MHYFQGTKWCQNLLLTYNTRLVRFRELDGVLVTIDEYGHLYCSYLGTDPSLFAAPYVENRMSNFTVRC